MIPAGGRIVVFASNRAGSTGAGTHVDVLGYLHTNFALSKSGEYLALVKPDGVTKATEFSPTYPVQVDDLSYGPPATTEPFVNETTAVRYLVPTSTAPDSSGHGLTANLNGTGLTFGTAGRSALTNTAVTFSGNGGLTVPFSAKLNPPSAFTFAAWVYPTGGVGSYRSVVTSRVGPGGQQRGYVIYLNPAGVWEYWTGSPGNWYFVTGPTVALNTWTHLAITRDAAGNKRLYINGSIFASANQPCTANNNPANGFHIGAGDDIGDNFKFIGRIDDVAFFPGDIGCALVQQHMNSGAGSFPTPLYPAHYQTDVQAAMFGIHPGIYTRHSFTITDKTRYASLRLRAKYDDAYVAYLNGVEVARRNFAGTRAYNSIADGDRADTSAVVFDEVNITAAG